MYSVAPRTGAGGAADKLRPCRRRGHARRREFGFSQRSKAGNGDRFGMLSEDASRRIGGGCAGGSNEVVVAVVAVVVVVVVVGCLKDGGGKTGGECRPLSPGNWGFKGRVGGDMAKRNQKQRSR